MQSEWTPVTESMPENNKPVLAFVARAYGGRHSRTVRAVHAAAKTIEIEDCWDEEDDNYDAETGTCYAPEGWYEDACFADEYGYFSIDGDVTHWMPLPAPPEVPHE